MSYLRPIVASLRLGVSHDLSWTNPLLSLALRTVAPLASAIGVSIIYWLGSIHAQSFDPARLSFVLVGVVLYTQIATYAYAPTLAIAEGKNLAVFPHVYIAPKSAALYLAGRTLGTFLVSLVSFAVALTGSYFVLADFLHTTIPLVITPASLLLLTVALVLNIPASLGLGFMLGAYSLFASKFEWALPSYISGLLMVFSGALFSPSILPWPLSAIANALPYTQFINASRDAIVSWQPGAYFEALGFSVVGGMAFLLVGLLLYGRSEQKARRDGVIDRRLA